MKKRKKVDQGLIIPKVLRNETLKCLWKEEIQIGHKRGSAVLHQEKYIGLADWIALNPKAILGRQTVYEFGESLPFLMKIIRVKESKKTCTRRLKLICLENGEALFLEPNIPYAYLKGTTVIELMASNPPRVEDDLPECSFNPRRILPRISGYEHLYRVSCRDPFMLSRIAVSQGKLYRSEWARSIEILFVSRGLAILKDMKTLKVHKGLQKGDFVIIPAMMPAYMIEGEAIIFKAAISIP